MTDEAMRRLARAADDDPQAEARLLLTRSRAGELGQLHLRLAAWLGHVPGAAALGEPCFVPRVEALQVRIMGLHEFGLVVALAGSAAVARLFLPAWERARPDDRSPHEALRALEAWLLEPGEAVAGACRPFAASCWQARSQVEGLAFDAGLAPRLARMACQQVIAGEALARTQRRVNATWAEELLEVGLDPLPVVTALRTELLPWALAGDPRVGRSTAVRPPPRPYSPATSFAVGDELLHSAFGRGEVVEVNARRIVVTFADGAKRSLAHATR